MHLFTKITDAIYLCDNRATRGNVGLISTDTGNYLIDTGMFPVTAKQLLEESKSFNKGNFEGVFTTHYHLDHTGGNQIFAHKPIYAHSIADNNFANYNQETIEKNSINDDNREFFKGFKLTGSNSVYSENEFSPPENNDIVCYLVGGHTSGSVLIHYKPENVVFAGDNLFAGLFPWGGDKTASPFDWINALDKIKSFHPAIVSPGHGPIQHNLDDVNFFKEYLLEVIDSTKKLLEEGKSDTEILEKLSNIPFHDPFMPMMKENSLKHWIREIKKKL